MASRSYQTPESVRLQQQAAEIAARTAASNLGFGNSGTVAAQALLGLGSGLVENYSQKQLDAQKAAQSQLLTQALLEQYQNRATPRPLTPQAGTSPTLAAPIAGSAPVLSSGKMSGGSDEKIAYIRQAAAQRGIDPDTAVAVARSEGLNAPGANNPGDGNSSFGPFQLHYGGIAPGGNKVSGLGDEFTKQTGLDARDPSTWKDQVDFALTNASQNGWGAWHGAQRIGLGNFQGIGSKPIAQANPPQLSDYTKDGAISDADAARYNADRNKFIVNSAAGKTADATPSTAGDVSLSPDASVLMGGAGADALGNPRPAKFPLALRPNGPPSPDASALLSPTPGPQTEARFMGLGNSAPTPNDFVMSGGVQTGQSLNGGINPNYNQGPGSQGALPPQAVPTPVAPTPPPAPTSNLTAPAAQALMPPAAPAPSSDVISSVDDGSGAAPQPVVAPDPMPAPTQLAGSALPPDTSVPAGMGKMLDGNSPALQSFPPTTFPQPVGGNLNGPSNLAGTMAGNPLQTPLTPSQPPSQAVPAPLQPPVAQPNIPPVPTVPSGTVQTSGLSPDASVLAGGAGSDAIPNAPMFSGGMGGNDPSSARAFLNQQASPSAAALMPSIVSTPPVTSSPLSASAPPPLAPSAGVGAPTVVAAIPPAPVGSPNQSSGIGDFFGGMFGGNQRKDLGIPPVPGVGPAAMAVLNNPDIDFETKKAFLPQATKPVELQLVDTPDGKRAFNPQQGTLGPVIAPSTKAEDYTFHQMPDGSIVKENKRTGDVSSASPAPAGTGAYTGNTPEVQGINAMVRDGRITKQQADDYLAGKVVIGPDGTHFVRPTDIFGGASSGAPPMPVAPPGTPAPTGAAPPPATPGAVGIQLNTPKAEKLTNDQTNAATYAGRMADAEKVLSNPQVITALQSPVNTIESKAPMLGNYLTSNQYQMGDQAKRAFVNAVLRKESGAAISQGEFANAEQQYFPQPGQGPDIIAQKAAARQAAIDSMKAAAGPAWKEPASAPSISSIGDSSTTSAPSAPQAAPISVRNAADYNAIQRGQQYVDPTGKIRIKQ